MVRHMQATGPPCQQSLPSHSTVQHQQAHTDQQTHTAPTSTHRPTNTPGTRCKNNWLWRLPQATAQGRQLPSRRCADSQRLLHTTPPAYTAALVAPGASRTMATSMPTTCACTFLPAHPLLDSRQHRDHGCSSSYSLPACLVLAGQLAMSHCCHRPQHRHACSSRGATASHSTGATASHSTG